jgi:hypothetical protein
MVNEMARLLTSLPRYTAYVRAVTESAGVAGVWKGKVRTLKLTDVAADAALNARTAIGENISDYTRPREKIREEINKRQERWRRGVSSDAPPAHIEEKNIAVSSEPPVSEREEEPPPTSVSTKSADSTEQTNEPIGGSYKTRLVYQSDFTKPTGLVEDHSESVSVFRMDGYYHITVYPPQNAPWYIAYFNPPIVMDNFMAQVDVEQSTTSGKAAECGIVFILREGADFELCEFVICPSGFYCLRHQTGEAEKTIIERQKSELIKSGDNTNTLMFERVGERITLGINGHVVATEIVSGLQPGVVGFFVRGFKGDLYAGARFRDFRLYSIE